MSTVDQDGDSQMTSPSESEGPTTPPLNQPTSHPASSTLSPPDSQHRSMANANGKRPLNDISNGADDEDIDINAMLASSQQQGASVAAASTSKPRQEFPTKTHQASGYKWSRAEEEPGYTWLNKKAMDEFHRAWDGLVHKESMVRARYGDPFEMADKERAVLNSLKQQ